MEEGFPYTSAVVCSSPRTERATRAILSLKQANGVVREHLRLLSLQLEMHGKPRNWNLERTYSLPRDIALSG